MQTPLDALQAVSLGKVDAYIGNLASVSFLIREHGLSNLKIAAPTEYGHYNLYMAVRDDWPELVSILNKALASFTPQQHSEIRNEWFAITYGHGLRIVDIPVGMIMLDINHFKKYNDSYGHREEDNCLVRVFFTY